MDEHSYNLLCRDAEKALLKGRLREALLCLQGALYACSEARLANEHESLTADYERMLHFMAEGGTDPCRGEIHIQLIRRAFALLENVRQLFRRRQDSGTLARLYNTLERSEQPDAETLTEKLTQQLQQLHEEQQQPSDAERIHRIRTLETACHHTLDTLFERLLTLPATLLPDEEGRIRRLLQRLPDTSTSYLLSALTLHLWESFDGGKFRILLHYCPHPNALIRTRAITGTVLIFLKYRERFAYYPELKQGLSLLSQETVVSSELLPLQKQLLISRESVRAQKKLEEEILPDLLKSKHYQRTKLGFAEIDADLAEALKGKAPSNQTPSKADKRLTENMQAFMEMGQEGVDVNWGTFSSLKRFDFFLRPGHWFLPFDPRRECARPLFYTPDEKPRTFLHFIMKAGNFCDSDRYSLCLMLQRIPTEQRSLVVDHLHAQLDDGELDPLIEISAHTAPTPEQAYRSYVENLYRFFKLFPSRREWSDPFTDTDLLFFRHEELQAPFLSPAVRRELAEFLMKRECYADAIDIWEDLQAHEGSTAELLQQLAYCHRRNGNPSRAALLFQQADLLHPDNEWILNQLHLCYTELGRFEHDLSCLLRLEEIEPENAKVISETGCCLMQLNRFEEAAQRFYKLEFMGERVLPAMRAIAWCSLKMKKWEQAEKYYRRILDMGSKAKWEDYLNAGHTAWLRGDLKSAIDLYRRYIARYREKAPKQTDGLQPFDDDRDELIAQGIAPNDICLMRDMIQPYTPPAE